MAKTPDGEPVAVHRLRLFTPDTLTSIKCMQLNEETKQLALLRRTVEKSPKNRAVASSIIEIWSFVYEDTPTLELVINDNDEEPSVLEALAWGANGRLFACGMNGKFNEYDFRRAAIKKSYSVSSGSAWCLAFDASKYNVVFGTENGHISVFNIDQSRGDEVNFDKTLAVWANRILSVAWLENSKDRKIVTGSLEYIAIWNYESGQCIEKMLTEKGAIIWCVAVFDNIIVSGDSNGITRFWDADSAILKKSFKTHTSHVLALCKGDHNNFFSSGVDHSIQQYMITTAGELVTAQPINVHTHDVHALVSTSSGWLLSGGVDTYLMKTFPNPKTVLRYSPNLTRNVNSCKNLVAMQYNYHVDVWRIDYAWQAGKVELNPTVRPGKIASVVSKRIITASNCSENWITYSTSKGLTVLNRSSNSLTKVKLLNGQVDGSISQIQFLAESVLSASCEDTLHIFSLDPLGITLIKKIPFKHHIHSHTFSDNHLAVVFGNHHVKMFNTDKWTEIDDFKVPALPVAIEFRDEELWLLLSNQTLVAYNVRKRKISTSFFLKGLDKFCGVRGMCFTRETVLVFDEDRFYSIDLVTGETRNVNTKYRHIAKMCSLKSKTNEVCIVEVTPEAIFRSLPPAFSKKRFGT